jgi:hypothetical protein
MAEKGPGSSGKSGDLSKFHQHKDGSVGWDTHDSQGNKVHIRGTDVSKDDPRNRGILSRFVSKLFGSGDD